ncbi:MAG: hypothetical protein WD178_08555, partial [Actinomycetota bacterium]
ARSLPYLVPNFVGSAVLAVLAARHGDWGFLLLESVWASVSAYGIFANLARRAGSARGGNKL